MPAPTITTWALVSLFKGFSDGVSVVAAHTEVVVPEVGCISRRNVYGFALIEQKTLERETCHLKPRTRIGSRAAFAEETVSIRNKRFGSEAKCVRPQRDEKLGKENL